jgi:hypothetical protein
VKQLGVLKAKTSSLDVERSQLQNAYVDKRIELDAKMFRNILENSATTIADAGEGKIKLSLPMGKLSAGVSGN